MKIVLLQAIDILLYAFTKREEVRKSIRCATIVKRRMLCTLVKMPGGGGGGWTTPYANAWQVSLQNDKLYLIQQTRSYPWSFGTNLCQNIGFHDLDGSHDVDCISTNQLHPVRISKCAS